KTNKVIKGFYFEGPFINVKYGCNSDLNPWSPDNIPEEQYKAFVDEAGTYAKVWITAPERADIKGFAEYARKVNPEVVFAVGHSEATPMQIRAMGKYRPTLQTHSMCATGRVPVCGGTRGYGPDEYCFKESEVYTELICDSLGIHVHPEMQQLLIHNKGIDKVILVTDSTMDDCENPPELAHITDLNFDHNGGLAGSRLTMDQACKNIMTNTNCGIAQAFLMASTNPAKAIKMDEEIGSIDIGKKADLVFVDDKFNVKQVMSEGKMVC
ncbi:MAG: amidohydrolase family protein, partial [Clostridia bacterium]|nr:amidohydrolase family protein [Clostridia bacterium]